MLQTAVRASNQNAHAEWFVQTIKQECLDWFIMQGERHLRYIIGEYVAHYNAERPHLASGNLPPMASQLPDRVDRLGPKDVVVGERLGGMLRHYERKVA